MRNNYLTIDVIILNFLGTAVADVALWTAMGCVALTYAKLYFTKHSKCYLLLTIPIWLSITADDVVKSIQAD